MTALDPVPEPVGSAALLDRAVSWARVAGELDAAVAGTAVLAAEIAASWTDRAGQGWAHRLDLVGRELDRQSGVAADLVRLVTALADEVGDPDEASRSDLTGPITFDAPAPDPGRAGPGPGRVDPNDGTGDDAGPSWSLPGPRLGGTEGGRASERRGVVVPTLPDQPGG